MYQLRSICDSRSFSISITAYPVQGIIGQEAGTTLDEVLDHKADKTPQRGCQSVKGHSAPIESTPNSRGVRQQCYQLGLGNISMKYHTVIMNAVVTSLDIVSIVM